MSTSKPDPCCKNTSQSDFNSDKIPSEWNISKLKYCAQFGISRGASTVNCDGNSDDISFVSPDQIQDGKILRQTRYHIKPSTALEFGIISGNNIAICTIGSVGKVTLVTRDFTVNPQIKAIIPNEDLITPKFLMYSLIAMKNEILNSSNISVIPFINGSSLMQIKTILPSLDSQRKISSLLETKINHIDEMIEEINSKFTILATMKLDWIESKFHELKAAQCTELSNNHLFTQRDERGEPNLPPLLVSLNSGVTVRQAEGYLRKQEASNLSNQKIARKGDIVFNKMRMWQGAVGVAPCDGLVSTDYTVAAPRKNVHSEFFMHLFRTIQYRTEINRWSHGIVPDRNRLYWEQFKTMKSSFPSFEKQVELADKIGRINYRFMQLGKLTEKLIDCLGEYRNRVISLTVTGKIDLSESV